MDIENVNNWVSEPNVCRCCLSTSGAWDLMASYVNNAGENQVYSEILQNCFGLSLSRTPPNYSLVCDLCVGRLQDANSFKNQVISADQLFISHHITKQGDNEFVEYDGSSDVESESKQNSETSTRTAVLNAEVSGPYSMEEEMVIEVPFKPLKLVSERKRIKMTCETVLKDTTACPFRHHRSWFQCFFCSQAFLDLTTLRTHITDTHTNITGEITKLKRFPRSLQIDISDMKCRLCNTNLPDVQTMQTHFAEVHNKMVYKECIADYKVNASPYSCHLCGKQFHVFRTLTTHLNEHYANFICDVCGKSFLNSKRLRVHNRTHESGLFPCSQCGKVLKTKTSKANHMETHSKRVIRCQICCEPMKHYNDRIKHMSVKHNITHKFKCTICEREYNIKHYLATHMRQTHGHRNKKCVECGMAFITNHGLKKHMLRHNTSK